MINTKVIKFLNEILLQLIYKSGDNMNNNYKGKTNE